MLERRNALAFARALLKGGGVSVFKKGKDGDVEGGGEKGRKRRRLPPGFLPSHAYRRGDADQVVRVSALYTTDATTRML